MSTTARPFPSEARPRLAWLALVAVLGVVLAACGGGGGGGGGGDGGLKLVVAVVNETTDDLTVSLDVGGEAGQVQTLATCKAEIYTFTLPDGEWVLALNGQTVIDSFELETNIVDRNLIAEVQANDDGTVTLTRVSPGSQVSKPAQAGICT
jgi:hypothetical protein